MQIDAVVEQSEAMAEDISAEVRRLADAAEASVDALVTSAVRAVFEQIPAFGEGATSESRRAVEAHSEAIVRAFLGRLREGIPVRPVDVALTRGQASLLLGMGISLGELLQGYRVGQLALWRGLRAIAEADPEIGTAAVQLVEPVMNTAEAASAAAAEAYLDAQQTLLAESDRARRDLLEDLLARRAPSAGIQQAMLRTAGLESNTRLVVLAATPVDSSEQRLLGEAATVLAGDRAVGEQGLTVVRHAEIIAVLPARRKRVSAIVSAVEQAWTQLSARGIYLAVGISTVRGGLVQIPEAYSEACVARAGAGPRAGVVALPRLSTLDYLLLRADDTARQMIRPQVRKFVQEDIDREGGLVETLIAYAAADLNAKVAATQLHVHVNTAYHRLERIAEKTGCDIRRFGDVFELVLAARLLGVQTSHAEPRRNV
ncbi:PucR family transcriptional regulator [Smaragdicoccus niigatensis]|uniref:PucR family transcriptional regulator n=1 Tax=Smaragdicoccus niigatensis TaxID=359359 RepID=UPI000373FA79|nr:helix-turn-helix domain-containing protein [Smaragdicoccus niigatensis]